MEGPGTNLKLPFGSSTTATIPGTSNRINRSSSNYCYHGPQPRDDAVCCRIEELHSAAILSISPDILVQGHANPEYQTSTLKVNFRIF
jgi:hypothetical protein